MDRIFTFIVRYRIQLYIVSVAVLVIGLNSKTETTRFNLRTQYTTYVSAEFSEINYDYEGYLETDSWSEIVSDIWTVTSINNQLETYNCPKSDLKGFKCRTPPIEIHLSNEPNFDNYARQNKMSYSMETPKGRRVIDKDQYKELLPLINQSVEIKSVFNYVYSINNPRE